MTFKFPYEAVSPNVLSVTPGEYKVKGNEIVYQLTNYEPQQDIEIEFLPYDFYERLTHSSLRQKKVIPVVTGSTMRWHYSAEST